MWLALLLWCLVFGHLIGPAHAAAPEDSMGAGCVEPGATGYYRVHDGSNYQWVMVLDTCPADGLPDQAKCLGGSFKNLTQNRTSCGARDTLTTAEGCTAIDVKWSSGGTPMATPSTARESPRTRC